MALREAGRGRYEQRKECPMRSTIWALVALSLVAAEPALAGGGAKGDVELGVYGGYGWPDDYGTIDPEAGPLFGARLGYFLTRHWGLEVSAQRLMTETDSLGPEAVDVRFDAIRLNGLYNFRADEKFRPFLTAVIGLEKFDIE